MKPFTYQRAASLDAALAQLSSDGSVVPKAGGIDILDLLKEHLIAPKKLVHLGQVAGLDQVSGTASKGMRLGPLLTLQAVSAHQDIQRHYPALAKAAGAVATPQIRNVATLGGNLCQRPRCWYFRSEEFECLKKGGKVCYAQAGENAFHAVFSNTRCAMVHPSTTAVALVALDAQLEISTQGKKNKRVIGLDQFFVRPAQNLRQEHVLKPNELISAILLPAVKAEQRSAYIKQKQKQSFDWPLAEIAVRATVQQGVLRDVRVVLGAAAPIPWRVTAVEVVLEGKKPTSARLQAAAKLVRQGARTLADNAYKLDLFEILIVRALTLLSTSQTNAGKP